MNKRIESIVKRIEKNNGKQITVRRDTLVKMAQEQLFDNMSYYSFSETFGESRGENDSKDYVDSCKDCASSSVGYCFASIKNNKIEFSCGVHSNRHFYLYINLNNEVKEVITTKEETAENNIILSTEEVTIKEVKNTTRIYFTDKPSQETIVNIKKLGFRFFNNDGLYWGIYTSKFDLAATKEALNIIENVLTDAEVEELNNISIEYTEQIKEEDNNIFIDYIKGGLKGSVMSNNNSFIAITGTNSRTYKTLKRAKEYMTTRGYTEVENVITNTVGDIVEVVEKSNVLTFGIDGEGRREEKQNITFEELKTEFNARVRDERKYQEDNDFIGGYCKTWIYIKYNDIEYRTCRLDLTGKEDVYICLSDALDDVLKGFKHNKENTCKYYFNSSDVQKCLELIQELIKFLKGEEVEPTADKQTENTNVTIESKCNLQIIKNSQEQPQEVNNIQIVELLYNDIQALENRLKLVTSAKLKYKIQSSIESKTAEVARIILSDKELYAQFMQE